MAAPPDLTPVSPGGIPTILIPLNTGGTDGVARRFQIRDERNNVLFSVDAASTDTIAMTAGAITAGGAAVTTETSGTRVETITQTIRAADLTDNLDTTGEVAMTGVIPAAATVLGTKVLVNAGFAGDTTAVVTIGDGVDTDRYLTGTPDVFTTATTGVETGIPSGAKLQLAQVNPVVTVTTATDFGLCATDDSGSMDVTVYFIVDA